MANNQFENGYALLVGVSDQEDLAIPQLPDVENDINAVRDVLINPKYCAYNPENVFVLTGKEATKESIKKGLDWLDSKVKNDTSEDATALFYFSGHGFQEDGESEHLLIPFDAKLDPAELADSSITDGYLKKKINGINPKRFMFILDCCQAGATQAKAINLDTVKVRAANPSVFVPDPDKTVLDESAREELGKNIPPPGSATTKKSDSKPIPGIEGRYVIIGDGRATLASSQGEEKSWILDEPEMSIFTYHLIEALTGHAPHTADATEVSILSVMDYVSAAVPKSASRLKGESQHPTFRMNGDNFPVAKLLGGKGIKDGAPLPVPGKLEAVPQSVVNTFKTNNATISAAFGIINQDITNSEIHISQSGNQANTDNSTHAGRDANTAREGSSLEVDNSTHTTGPGLAGLFNDILADIKKRAEADPSLDADLLIFRTENAQKELEKNPEKETNARKWLDALKENAPDILGKVADIVANPGEGVAIGIRTIANLIKKVNT